MVWICACVYVFGWLCDYSIFLCRHGLYNCLILFTLTIGQSNLKVNQDARNDILPI